MKTDDIGMHLLREAPWNPNRMDDAASERLRESLIRYGLVQPLVVRPMRRSSHFEVLSGNQRLRVMRETGITHAPCVVINVDDEEAMLLAEALNEIHGDDDLALKGALLKKILVRIPHHKVLSLLPETAESLQALSTMGQDDLAEHLEAWQEAQKARLRHMQLQFSDEQLETVEKALDMAMAKAKNSVGSSPNIRGTAMYLLARFYLERHRRR